MYQSQQNMYFHAVLSESSMSGFWITKDAMFLHVDNENVDQTARISRQN